MAAISALSRSRADLPERQPEPVRAAHALSRSALQTAAQAAELVRRAPRPTDMER